MLLILISEKVRHKKNRPRKGRFLKLSFKNYLTAGLATTSQNMGVDVTSPFGILATAAS